jgi:hypothetical protein
VLIQNLRCKNLKQKPKELITSKGKKMVKLDSESNILVEMKKFIINGIVVDDSEII